jgi:glycosyltransferase involved in cell wall biosynthesis
MQIPKLEKLSKKPFVSICTPTFNRRPFFPVIIKCFENQKYPKDKIEWIIIDDGSDKIEDLVSHIPQVKYFKYDEKMTLGKKRNLMHEKCKGDVIIYMDDDDYYPPERISHAVDTLRNNPKKLCAGSSEMYIYFKHISKMYQFGPYGPNHSTAGTFAFRKELLQITSYDNNACLAEERHFLKEYTIPFAQLDTMKTILVFSHIQNTFDKKTLLNCPNDKVKVSDKKVDDFVKETDIKKFFLEDIDDILDKYEEGSVINKPDVIKQTNEIHKNRMESAMNQQKQMTEYNQIISKIQKNCGGNNLQQEQQVTQMNTIIQELSLENNQLKEKVKYLEDKIKKIITDQIEKKKNEMKS